MLYTKFVYLIQTHRQKSNPGKRELSQDKCHEGLSTVAIWLLF